MERLQALLAKAQSVEDLIVIESAISDTQLEIDQLTGSLQGMDSRVADATLDLTLSELSSAQTAQNKEETLPERIASFEGRLGESIRTGVPGELDSPVVRLDRKADRGLAPTIRIRNRPPLSENLC